MYDASHDGSDTVNGCPMAAVGPGPAWMSRRPGMGMTGDCESPLLLIPVYLSGPLHCRGRYCRASCTLSFVYHVISCEPALVVDSGVILLHSSATYSFQFFSDSGVQFFYRMILGDSGLGGLSLGFRYIFSSGSIGMKSIQLNVYLHDGVASSNLVVHP